MGFLAELSAAPLAEWLGRARSATRDDVERALAAPAVGMDQLPALLSPAARDYLEPLAQRAARITRERFGRVMHLYAPIYISNECTGGCVYCGFNRENRLPRVTLTPEEVTAEAEILWRQGFRDLLLVSGEAPKAVSLESLAHTAAALHTRFPSLAVEVYPLSAEGYETLAVAGVDGVTVYQETYDPALYAEVHLAGRKRDFAWRLETPARAGEAGMRRVGIGSLLGLGDWRRETLALGLHALWLQKHYWRTQVSVSFPRMRAAAGCYQPPHPVSDTDLVQMACALRLLLPDAGFTLSTREAPSFRDGLVPICITAMSAGSRTEPGGYAHPGEAGEQFRVEDHRSPAEVARMLLRAGLEPVWKDWDGAFMPEPTAKADSQPVNARGRGV
jgi:2-iminoacetate synthase